MINLKKSSDKEKVDALFAEYEQKINKGINVCVLGSCQYKTIQDTAEFVIGLLKAVGPEETEKMLGMKYSRKITDYVEFEQHLLGLAKGSSWTDFDTVEEMGPEEFFEGYPDYADDIADGRLPVKALMAMYRDQAWDLWSAMPSIFEGLELDEVELPTYGPMLNMMCQVDNYRLGVELGFILYYFEGVGVKLEDFADFDT